MPSPILTISAPEPEYDAMLADLTSGILVAIGEAIEGTARVHGGEIEFRVGRRAAVHILAEAGPDTPYPQILDALRKGWVTPSEAPDIRWNGGERRVRVGGCR